MPPSAFCHSIGGVDVGNVDTIIGSADLRNSGYATELAWAQGLLSNLYGGDPSDYYFPEESSIQGNSGFTLADGQDPQDPDIYGMDFADYYTDYPTYYFIKYGDGGIQGLNSHQMYSNSDMLQWAVISLDAVLEYDEVSTATNFDIQRVSHIQGVGDGSTSVPEPTTILLLGAGLIGLAGFTRKKSKK